MKKLNYLLLFSMCFIILLACNEDETQPESQVDTQITSDEVQVESTTDLLYNLSDYYLELASIEGSGKPTEECPTVSFQIFQKKITVDFGDDGCVGPYGSTHYGKIIISYEGSLDAMPVSRTISTENYRWNIYPIEATITATGFMENNEGGYDFDRRSDVKVTFPNETNYSLISNYKINWQEGFNDANPFNDVIQVSGNSTGKNRQGNTFSAEISTPLLIKTTCANSLDFLTVSGVKEVDPARLGDYKVDYGDGACDRNITITTANRTFDISLP